MLVSLVPVWGVVAVDVTSLKYLMETLRGLLELASIHVFVAKLKRRHSSEADLDWRRLEVGFTAACRMRGRSDLA